MELEVSAKVHPTESSEKVRKAILNLFKVEVEEHTDGNCRVIVGRGRDRESLERFYEVIRSHAIMDSARRVLLAAQYGNRLEFRLNKQAAFMGAVNFLNPRSEGTGELGGIKVEVRDAQGVVDWLAPGTNSG